VFDFGEFMEVARLCSAQRGGEAFDRSAINRAYYAAYHSAVSLGERRGKPLLKNGAAHQAVRVGLTDINEDLGDDLSELWELRRRADYDKRYEGDLSSDVQSALDLAGDLVNRLARMS
jgi:uncharacterized protein (UPF0332 family)